VFVSLAHAIQQRTKLAGPIAIIVSPISSIEYRPDPIRTQHIMPSMPNF
jgi:hypothetical protein